MAFGPLLDSFKGKSIVVLGDVMLDEYLFGTIDRISPEAPVMVVRKKSVMHVPGGAANVAKNIMALGGNARVVGVVGDDRNGEAFMDSLGADSRIESRVIVSKERMTTTKTRVVANHSHQVLRIDEECSDGVDDGERDLLVAEIEQSLKGADCLVMSDYLKGVLTPGVASHAIKLAREKGIPVAVNAKPKSARYFSGADLLTLNRREAEEVFDCRISDPAIGFKAAREGLRECKVGCVVVTLGDQGLVASWEEGQTSCPAPEVEAYDVAGAGDTTLATLALGLATRGLCAEIFDLAVQTSAKVVQHVGVAVPSETDLAQIRSLG